MTKIILRKNVARIGKAGDVIAVKDGFARNFLLPQGLAFLATHDNLKRVEKDKARLERERLAEKEKINQLAERLNGFSCTITAEAHDESLYGSIDEGDIIKAIEEEQITLDRDSIMLDQPIKKLGIYEVGIRLSPDVNATIKVWVVKK